MNAVFLVIAGIVAGTIGAAGGITSLISYPALLVTGLSAFSANVVNIVAYVTALPGSALGSRPELKGRSAWLRRWAPVVAGGGGAGALLLVLLPPGVFAGVVPYLVLLASFALIAESRLRRWFEARSPEHSHLILSAGLLPLSLYLGYFGAGSGVMVLTLLMVVVDRRLPVANALKNMLLGAGSICAVIVLVCFAPVHWGAAIPLGAGIFIGSRIGPVVARRLPVHIIRPAIALFGVALAVELWLHPAG